MHFDQYTPDAITQSMGLGPFVNPAWDSSEPLFRLLLTPSFHPEFCLDLESVGSQRQISAVCLSEMLWKQSSPRRLPAFYEQKLVGEADYDRILAHCSNIDTNAKPPLFVDGMSLHAAWTCNGELIQFDSHVHGRTVTDFVVTVLEFAWSIFNNPVIRNGIANCGEYVGLNYPIEPEPPKPTRLLVQGSPEDVADYFKRLREHRDGA